ncbi:MAG: UPF0280 family protein [Candidatus Omnitrophica bacterium]|nr:UPF0280 family protein [Candidatus Omnitrophota bacterium]
MKSNNYQRRFYRDWVGNKHVCSEYVVFKETDLQILTDRPVDKDFIKDRVGIYRREIENYIDKDRRFLTALKPIEVELNAPLIVSKMSKASRLANVGPMAAVAGAIAGFLGRDLLKKGYKNIIIENGGDIFLKTTKPCVIGIYSGRSKIWNKLGLKIKAKDTPLGIATSSATLGHSLSFGSADSVTILAQDASLADAVATAVCNRVKSKEDLSPALNFARSIKGVCGAVIILKNDLISWGRLEFVK